jgi:hypothetical protein
MTGRAVAASAPAIDHAAAPPRTVMNSRRLIDHLIEEFSESNRYLRWRH